MQEKLLAMAAAGNPVLEKNKRWDHARGTVRAETDPVPPLPQLSVVRVRKKGFCVIFIVSVRMPEQR